MPIRMWDNKSDLEWSGAINHKIFINADAWNGHDVRRRRPLQANNIHKIQNSIKTKKAWMT